MGHPLDAVIWRKSSYSGSYGGDCVEVVALRDQSLAVRDSKDPDGPMLTFTRAEWRTFISAVKAGAHR
jgi:Domain of unknown function (DUF397)